MQLLALRPGGLRTCWHVLLPPLLLAVPDEHADGGQGQAPRGSQLHHGRVHAPIHPREGQVGVQTVLAIMQHHHGVALLGIGGLVVTW